MQKRGDQKRFVLESSYLYLPLWRRAHYLDMCIQGEKEKLTLEDVSSVCKKWTQEDGKYYSYINGALLADDQKILNSEKKYIFSLKAAIKTHYPKNPQPQLLYRALNVPKDVAKEYKEGVSFLWPTFSSTSKERKVAEAFGDYLFVIEAPGSGINYYADISSYSPYDEAEVLFYPYSGFKVVKVEGKVIRIQCQDTIQVEKKAETTVKRKIVIYDESRKLYVRIGERIQGSQRLQDVYMSMASNRDEWWLIAENRDGYWDAPHRFHHSKGCFLKRGKTWEEWHGSTCFAKFKEVEPWW